MSAGLALAGVVAGPLNRVTMAMIFLVYTAASIDQSFFVLQSSALSWVTTCVAIQGALTLYLDFVNLFLQLLRLFGRRR